MEKLDQSRCVVKQNLRNRSFVIFFKIRFLTLVERSICKTEEGSQFPPEKDRYHLYVAYAWYVFSIDPLIHFCVNKISKRRFRI